MVDSSKARDRFAWPVAGLAAAAMAACLAGAAAAQPIQTRLGNCTINDAVHRHMELWKVELETRSNGRIKADMYVNCQLGSIPRQIEGIQLGTQDFFTVPPSFAAGVDPRYGVADALGVFDNLAHAHRAVTHPIFYDKFMQIGRDKGITPVSLWAAGRANYLTLFPFQKHDDFKGKKIRVLATKLESEFIARHGATGVPITFTEIVPSLVTKTIDGARTAILVMASAKMYSAAKYVTLVDDGIITVVAWFSNQYLNKLPSDLREMVFKIGRDLEPRMLPISENDHERGLKELKDNGVQVFTLPPEEHRAWIARSRLVADEVLGAHPALKDTYAALKEAAEKTRQ
jgi:C4-dicarboxylate-binding protein DctP